MKTKERTKLKNKRLALRLSIESYEILQVLSSITAQSMSECLRLIMNGKIPTQAPPKAIILSKRYVKKALNNAKQIRSSLYVLNILDENIEPIIEMLETLLANLEKVSVPKFEKINLDEPYDLLSEESKKSYFNFILEEDQLKNFQELCQDKEMYLTNYFEIVLSTVEPKKRNLEAYEDTINLLEKEFGNHKLNIGYAVNGIAKALNSAICQDITYSSEKDLADTKTRLEKFIQDERIQELFSKPLL